jgi:mannitol-1-phosphate/altronate dehydrogenase
MLASPDLADLVADIAREECKKLDKRRLAGLEEELAAVYRTLEE